MAIRPPVSAAPVELRDDEDVEALARSLERTAQLVREFHRRGLTVSVAQFGEEDAADTVDVAREGGRIETIPMRSRPLSRTYVLEWPEL